MWIHYHYTGNIPGLTKLMCLTGHNSYQGCRYCNIRGIWSNHIYYPTTPPNNFENDTTYNIFASPNPTHEVDQLTREQILNNVIILETSLISYQHGSSVAHTDFDTYVNSSDFLMLFTYPKTATLGQIMSAVGSTNTTGPIGPKLRLLLGSLGYEVKKEYTPPVKLSNGDFES
ncbi:hypothetical protein GLOIN_2v1871614 [Rhizophagus irregularis DAOM 181602=DAOM 197198]|nr:hypothetical protein GLOIN_2v1871614 [Rhizophagus irregularis DAOM 181602=DAOM 197198]